MQQIMVRNHVFSKLESATEAVIGTATYPRKWKFPAVNHAISYQCALERRENMSSIFIQILMVFTITGEYTGLFILHFAS